MPAPPRVRSRSSKEVAEVVAAVDAGDAPLYWEYRDPISSAYRTIG